MEYLIGNVCYIVVISDQLLSYPVRRKKKIQRSRVQQYDFVNTSMFHVGLFTSDFHTTNKQHFHCVPQCRDLTKLPRYTHEKVVLLKTSIT